MFRKVKSIQYSAEGKVYEYTLDLGEITKIVKEIAKVNGWKFKTVLKKEKAMYPGGASNMNRDDAWVQVPPTEVLSQVAPEVAPQATPQVLSQGTFQVPPVMMASQPNQQGTGTASTHPKQKTLAILGWLILGIIAVGISFLMEINLVGLVAVFIVVLLTGIMVVKLSKKGCLTILFIMILMAVSIFVIWMFTLDATDEDEQATSKISKEVTANKLTEANNEQTSSDAESGQPEFEFSYQIANSLGNTNGNIINNGYATIQEDIILFTANNNLYWMTNDGQTLITLLDQHDFFAQDLNLVGEWLYYVDQNSHITRLNIKTNDIETMEGFENIDNLFVTNEGLYFISDARPGFLDLSGQNYIEYHNSYAQSLNIFDSYVFYQDNASYTVAIKQKKDGTEKQTFTPDLLNYSMFFVVADNKVYYTDNNTRNICQVDLNGENRKVISTDQTLLINISNDYIYYVNESDGNKVYRVSVDGTVREKVFDKSSEFISIVGDFLVITTVEDGSEATYVCYKDGQDFRKIE